MYSSCVHMKSNFNYTITRQVPVCEITCLVCIEAKLNSTPINQLICLIEVFSYEKCGLLPGVPSGYSLVLRFPMLRALTAAGECLPC